MTAAVRTTCPYCGVGCGVLARIDPQGAVQISGDPDHPANRGALCSKGAALGETLGLDGRLLTPRLHGRDVAWDQALTAVASGFRRIIEQHGPDAVAFYVSGQLLTEDYYVANKLMKGFIGSANIDTNSRLCMSSAVAAHKRAFGEDLVPITYEDLELADLHRAGGLEHWLGVTRALSADPQGQGTAPAMRVVVIDPRRTPTCDTPTCTCRCAPARDVTLFNGLLDWLAQHRIVDQAFVEAHTRGAAQAARRREHGRRCWRGGAALRARYQALQSSTNGSASAERVVTLFSQGVNQSSSGTDKANSIINVHLLTGESVGRAWAVLHHRSTQRDGRARGRRARQHAGGPYGTRQCPTPPHGAGVLAVRREWPNEPGSKRSTYSRRCIVAEIKAMWIIGHQSGRQPSERRSRARGAAPLSARGGVRLRSANRYNRTVAHVLLPAAAWGEKEGTVTNSDRHISRQRELLADARHGAHRIGG